VLARRGSAKVLDAERLAVLKEMLDPDWQGKNFRVRLKNNLEVPDEVLVNSTVTGALKGIVELHHKRPEVDLSDLNAAVEALTKSPNPAVRVEAERAHRALQQN